jgi:hypothetical protein
MSELDEVIAGLTEAHKANGNLMISLPGGASILNVLQLIDWLKQVPQEEPKVRGRKGESRDEQMDKTGRAPSGEC